MIIDKRFVKWVGWCLLMGLSLSAHCANAADRDQSVRNLSELVDGSAAARLDVTLESAGSGSIQVGSSFELRLKVGKPSYITLALVDAHGVLQVAQPVLGNAGNFIATPGEIYLPVAENSIPVLTARPPEGKGDLFVISSDRPLDLSGSLGKKDAISMNDMMFSVEQSREVTATIAASLTKDGRASGAVARVPLVIASAGEPGNYSPEQIVRYFTETTRSIDKPRLDIHINFAFNSADILSTSVKALDTWGRVLSDPLMSGQAFVIGGHTDDVGTPQYNEELSLRRAQAVRDYLISRYSISSARLKVQGYGMGRRLVDGTDDTSRAMNRRVDFERMSSKDR